MRSRPAVLLPHAIVAVILVALIALAAWSPRSVSVRRACPAETSRPVPGCPHLYGSIA